MNYSNRVQQLITQIDAGTAPVSVDVEVWTEGEYRKCHGTVAYRVAIDGGRVRVGWRLVETQDYVMAWSHAVWEAPDGRLLDITPMNEETTLTHVLFLPDNRLPVSGRPSKPNQYWWSPERHDVGCMLKVLEVLNHLQNDLPENIPDELNDIIVRYRGLLRAFMSFVGEGKALNSPCPCSSGLSFDKCHAISIDTEIRRDKDGLAKLGY